MFCSNYLSPSRDLTLGVIGMNHARTTVVVALALLTLSGPLAPASPVEPLDAPEEEPDEEYCWYIDPTGPGAGVDPICLGGKIQRLVPTL